MDSKMAEAERRIEEALRTGAEWLDLGDLALDELPPRIGELRQLRGLALGTMALSEAGELKFHSVTEAPELADLTPLSGLTSLETLSLYGCSRVADLSPLASVTGLLSLDLSGTGVSDLSQVAPLTNLQRLDFGFTDVEDLSPVATLSGLQSLIFYGCSGVADLSPVASLTGLKHLEFGDTGVNDLSPVASLTKIQNLGFIYTGVTDLSPIAFLTGLQFLYLGPFVTDLLPVASLSGLKTLDLGGCSDVLDLSPVASLSDLETLDLGSCTGVRDLSPLALLACLKRLNLSGCTGVADLSPVASLIGLQFLDISRCAGVTDFLPLSALMGLIELRLFEVDVTFSEPLLRSLAALPLLEELVFYGGKGVPQEILSKTYGDSCLLRLRAHFADVDEAAEAENEVKIILLGNGRVGKTQLCRRFRSLKPDESIVSTHGVQLWREPLQLRVSGEVETYQANWWDFGGQDIYHGTHALFLRSRAVFLILWNPGLENRDELEENGIPLRNQQLTYWLDYVRSLAGSKSPVILVQSRCDTFGQERLLPVQPEGFEFLRSTAYSAWTDLGRETLEGQIRDAIRYLREKHGALFIGRGRAEVRRKLYEMREADKERAPEERQHRTLTLEEFRSLCEQTGGISSPESALDYLHQTGVVFYRSDLFSERVVLDQTWALDAVYAVFDRRRAAPFLRGSGRFTRKQLEFIVWSKHSEEEQRLFLDLMESCGICFKHGKNYEGETEYVAPDLLPPFAAIQRRLYAWRQDAPITTLRLSYRFFHQAIVRGLMSRVGQIAGEAAEYWKYGFWLYDRMRDSQVLVQQNDTYSAEAPGAGVLEIQARGRDALGLLRLVHWLVLRTRIGEEFEQSLTIEGATVLRSELAHALGGQVRTTDGRVVSAAPFVAFFEERRREGKAEDAKPARLERTVDLDPAPAPEPDRRPEVFISYAWGDDSWEGLRRAAVVDRLQEELEKTGFTVQRDRDAQRPGDRISQFMKRLKAADRVVTVISGKYLTSVPCMDEIYRVYQRCQEEPNLFAERVVPIILPEVQVRRPEQRVPIVRHWSARADELELLLKELGTKAGSATWEEARLARALSEHVDNILGFVVDILIPRKLDVPLESDFEGVKAALLRRLKS